MSTTIDDAVFLKELAAIVSTSTTRPAYVDKVPPNVDPVLPYSLVHPVGGVWDRPLFGRVHSAGWYVVQFTSVGKGVDKNEIADFLALAARTRSALEGALAGSGWSACDAESEGPPLPVDSAGTLQAVAERIRIYVQAV